VRGGAIGLLPKPTGEEKVMNAPTAEEIRQSNANRESPVQGRVDTMTAHEIASGLAKGPNKDPGEKAVPAPLEIERWADQLVSERNEELMRDGASRRGVDPKTGKTIPVWPKGFKCRFCDESFMHLTSDHFIDPKTEKDYWTHLVEDHEVEFKAAQEKLRNLVAGREGTQVKLDSMQSEIDSLKKERQKMSDLMREMRSELKKKSSKG